MRDRDAWLTGEPGPTRAELRAWVRKAGKALLALALFMVLGGLLLTLPGCALARMGRPSAAECQEIAGLSAWLCATYGESSDDCVRMREIWYRCCEKGEPLPDPTPKPTPTPTPARAKCPAQLPDISALTINARCQTFDPRTGKCRTDSTPRVGDKGDDAGYCGTVTGNPAIHSCKAGPEGAGADLIAACDRAFIGYACMPWFYSVNGGQTWKRCLPDSDGALPEFSCDHFDDYSDSTGLPYAGSCERGASGGPITGFHMVPHGKGLVRACNAAQTVCSEPIRVDY